MLTRISLPTDGTIGPFPIGFNYLSGETISVTRTDTDGVTNPVPLAFVFVGTKSENQPSGSSIRLTEAQASGKLLVIRKTIDMDSPVVNWGTGSEVSQKNLQTSSRNLMEMAQQAHDVATEALTRNQAVLDGVASIVPSEVLDAAASIQADRVLAQAAASSAQAVQTSMDTRMGTELELDFGSTPIKDKVFSVSVPGVPVGPVRVDHILRAATGRAKDENELERFSCIAYAPSVGTVEIAVASLQGPVTGLYPFVLSF